MSSERAARSLLVVSVLGLPLAVFLARPAQRDSRSASTIVLHGTMPEHFGWDPDVLRVSVGDTLFLRLTSDDVTHGFAVGMMDMEPVDVRPGEVTEAMIVFDRPGRYVFYCTRWCGVDHWRMRGTIEVSGNAPEQDPSEQDPSERPLFLRLGLDLDAPHPADVLPARLPSADLGLRLDVIYPAGYRSRELYQSQSPAETWRLLRSDSATTGHSDQAVWDLVASIWRRSTTQETLDAGAKLYSTNCAACHGEDGGGTGVMASALVGDTTVAFGHSTTEPADFTDRERMLGASPALLHGKIVRGGMGTGMPYFGPVFTEEQIWEIVDYLWTFQYSTRQDDG